jgi:hypothetical protein
MLGRAARHAMHVSFRDFYGPFEQDLARAKVEMRDLKREEELSRSPRVVRSRSAEGGQGRSSDREYHRSRNRA